MTIRIPMGGLLETTHVVGAAYGEVTGAMRDSGRFAGGIEAPWGRDQARYAAEEFGARFAQNAAAIEEGLANLLGAVEAVYTGWAQTDAGLGSEFAGMTFEEAMTAAGAPGRAVDWPSGMTDTVAPNPNADRGEDAPWVAPAKPSMAELEQQFPDHDEFVVVGHDVMPRYQAVGMTKEEYLTSEWDRFTEAERDKATGAHDYRGTGERIGDAIKNFFRGD